jgi:hypothetical protein
MVLIRVSYRAPSERRPLQIYDNIPSSGLEHNWSRHDRLTQPTSSSLRRKYQFA